MKTRVLAILLAILGLLQMGGDLLGLSSIKGLGAVSGASPAPKVFSSVKGLETYSSRYYVEWDQEDGRTFSIELTPELYGKIKGPYNRRNVYGAALAYGPILSSDEKAKGMFEAVWRHALCGKAPLLAELDLAQEAKTRRGEIRVRLVQRPGSDFEPSVLEVPCNP